MPINTAPTLDRAVKAARSLPKSTQAELAIEILERVTGHGQSLLSDDQRAEIRRRLDAPPRYADDAQMQAFFASHHVDL